MQHLEDSACVAIAERSNIGDAYSMIVDQWFDGRSTSRAIGTK
jgi:hypothetical protein